MVVAVVNNFTTVPTIRGVFDANGLENGTVFEPEQVYNVNGTTWANRATAVTLLNNEKLFYYLYVVQTWAGQYDGHPSPTWYARLFNETSGVAIPTSTLGGSGSSSGAVQIEYLNNTGGTIVIRPQAYGTGGTNNYFIIYKHGYNILNTTDLPKWEEVTAGSLTARHRKQYIENIYLFCPRYGTSVTVDGITQSHGQPIKVIPVNNISTRLDYQGTGKIFTALTGKGFNVEV